MGDVIWSHDFSARRERDHAQFLIAKAISQAMADEVFVDMNEMSIEERVRRSIYHGAGLPYPKDSA